MSNYQQEITKFEFLLSLGGNIVCQRFFNVKDHVPQARRSMDLHYYIKNICDEISDDLKMKTSDYLSDVKPEIISSSVYVSKGGSITFESLNDDMLK